MILFVLLSTPSVYFKCLLISGHLESFLGGECSLGDEGAYCHAWVFLVNYIHLVLDTNLFLRVYIVDHIDSLWVFGKLNSPVVFHAIWFLCQNFLNLLCSLLINFKVVFDLKCTIIKLIIFTNSFLKSILLYSLTCDLMYTFSTLAWWSRVLDAFDSLILFILY